MFLFLLDLRDNLIQQIIEEFMGVLVHCGPKYFIEFFQLVDKSAWSHSTLFARIGRDIQE
jgi:hypothetical protein